MSSKATTASSLPSRSPAVEGETDHGRLRENWAPWAARAALAIAFDVKPPRHRAAPRLVARLLRHILAATDARRVLPSPDDALPGREGVAGYCDDMSVETLRRAYAQGLYPCTHFGPMRWNAPPLRAVLAIREFRLRDELKRKLKKRAFRVTFDAEPRAVMLACAAPRPGQWPLTWITPEIVEAYMALYAAGDMHSVEVWDESGALVGGLFGTVVGRCFVIESLFHLRDHTSKYGLAVLIAHLQAWGFSHVDNKLQTPHAEALGFREMARAAYVAFLSEPTPEAAARRRWVFDAALDLGNWKPEQGGPVRTA